MLQDAEDRRDTRSAKFQAFKQQAREAFLCRGRPELRREAPNAENSKFAERASSAGDGGWPPDSVSHGRASAADGSACRGDEKASKRVTEEARWRCSK